MPTSKVTIQKPDAARLFHLFYFSRTGFLAAVLQWALGIWAYMVMALLWLPSIGLMPWIWMRLNGKQVELHSLAMLMILVSWMGVVSHSGAFPLLRESKTLPEVFVRDLAQYPAPLLVHVRDGKVQTRFAYQHTSRQYDARRSTTTITQSCVAPVTPSDWMPDQIVPLWAVCPELPGECRQCPHWRIPDADLIPPLTWSESSAHEAARQAAEKQNLRLSNPVRVGVWVSSAHHALMSHVALTAGSIWGIFLVWAACRGLQSWWQ